MYVVRHVSRPYDRRRGIIQPKLRCTHRFVALETTASRDRTYVLLLYGANHANEDAELDTRKTRKYHIGKVIIRKNPLVLL